MQEDTNDDARADVLTRFKTGNQAWKARTKHGRDKLFANSDILWAACVEYFEWNSANPLWEAKSYQYQGVPVQDCIPKMRAMTIAGLCIFLDITQVTWRDYKSNPDFSFIIDKVEAIIRTQKLEGAAADLLNANIIARELGLADKNNVDVTTNGKDMAPTFGSLYGTPDGDAES